MPGSWRDVLSANALIRSRDAPRIRVLLEAEKATPKSPPKTPPLKEGRRSADKRIHRAASKSDAARVLSPSPHAERTEAARTSWSGRARLSAPHRGIRGFLTSARLRPRFLEPPDANGRTLSGTSAASTSQSDTRRTGR